MKYQKKKIVWAEKNIFKTEKEEKIELLEDMTTIWIIVSCSHKEKVEGEPTLLPNVHVASLAHWISDTVTVSQCWICQL